MSQYLIEQIAALANVNVLTGSTATAAEGEDGQLRRVRIDGPDGEETLAADACFVFIGASPRTDWLEGVVARDERGFILAGRDVQADGWPLEREPYVLETTVPGRVRRRRRARALDQAGRQRRGRGLDGGVADPRVPGRGVSDAPVTEAPVTLEELRGVDLFDDLDDAELAEWVPRRTGLPRGARRADRRAGRGAEGPAARCSRARRRRCSSIRGAPSRSAATRAPTWMGAIAVLTGGALGARMQARDRLPDGGDAPPRTSAGWRSPSRRSTAG